MRRAAVFVLFLAASIAAAQQPAKIQHVVVALQEGKFHGWPANNGSWSWGDEILVGYTQGDFEIKRGHNIAGKHVSMFSRSMDGGETWEMFDPENFLDSDELRFLGQGKTKLENPINFQHDGFAMRVFAEGYHGNDDPEGGFYYSYDRGRTWNGPYFLGDIAKHDEFRDRALSPRTDYVVQTENNCLVFVSARPREGGPNRIAAIKTVDGGRSFDFLSWVTPLSDDENAIMSQTVQLAPEKLLLAYRKIVRRQQDTAAGTEREPNAIEAYLSEDNGASWKHLSTVVEIGGGQSNPPALLELRDGRLCCIYGDRHRVKMLGRYSADHGKTWGEEFVIRDDFSGADPDTDFGYPRLAQREDGKLVAMYYWATKEHPQQYIAASIWTP